jgi:hypothetical protein
MDPLWPFLQWFPHGKRVEYASSTAMKMSIDRRTAVNLELISNARRYVPA